MRNFRLFQVALTYFSHAFGNFGVQSEKNLIS